MIDISLRLIGHVVHLHRILVVRISNVCVEFSILRFRSGASRQSLLIFFLDFVENQTLKGNSKCGVKDIDDTNNPNGKPRN